MYYELITNPREKISPSRIFEEIEKFANYSYYRSRLKSEEEFTSFCQSLCTELPILDEESALNGVRTAALESLATFPAYASLVEKLSPKITTQSLIKDELDLIISAGSEIMFRFKYLSAILLFGLDLTIIEVEEFYKKLAETRLFQESAMRFEQYYSADKRMLGIINECKAIFFLKQISQKSRLLLPLTVIDGFKGVDIFQETGFQLRAIQVTVAQVNSNDKFFLVEITLDDNGRVKLKKPLVDSKRALLRLSPRTQSACIKTYKFAQELVSYRGKPVVPYLFLLNSKFI